VKALVEADITRSKLSVQLKADARFESALAGLLRDGLVTESATKLHLTK